MKVASDDEHSASHPDAPTTTSLQTPDRHSSCLRPACRHEDEAPQKKPRPDDASEADSADAPLRRPVPNLLYIATLNVGGKGCLGRRRDIETIIATPSLVDLPTPDDVERFPEELTRRADEHLAELLKKDYQHPDFNKGRDYTEKGLDLLRVLEANLRSSDATKPLG